MDKDQAFNTMRKAGFELDDKRSEFEQAKDIYRKALVGEAVAYIFNVLKEEGSLTERDLTHMLEDLSLRTMQIYSK
jgi:hypothetical protein